MSFLRHGEIYPFDEGAIPQDRALAHRTDEFRAGYSSAGCTPAEPASASPAGGHLAGKPVRCTIEFQRTASSLLTVCLSPGDHPTPSLPCDCQTFPLDASSTAHVQVPSYFTPTGFSAPIISGCPSGNDGYFAEVYYQVTDQNKDAIHLAGMTPQEHFTVSGHPAFFGFKPFATPQSTPGSGAFADTPIGSCIAPPSPPNHCVDVVQTFDLVIGTQTFTINTTTTRRDCQDGIRVQIVPGTTYTQGTVN